MAVILVAADYGIAKPSPQASFRTVRNLTWMDFQHSSSQGCLNAGGQECCHQHSCIPVALAQMPNFQPNFSHHRIPTSILGNPVSKPRKPLACASVKVDPGREY